MSINLKLGTLTCPHDQAILHFEVLGMMRVKRKDDTGPGHIYQARCPICGEHFKVDAPKEKEVKKMKDAELVKAFQAALKYLSPTRFDTYGGEDGKTFSHEFICHCLNRAAQRNDITSRAANRAGCVVRSRLGGHSHLQSWLREHHPELAKVMDADGKRTINHDGRKVQEARRNWLNSLITEFGV